MTWEKAVNQAITLRHWFHQHPELTWQEEHTAKKIRDCLDDWGIEWRACAIHGTVATLAPELPGRHVALRADMDALPINEQTGVAFCSTESGKMHACGHDGHMAALLGTAMWLKNHESKLPGPVSLIFQPAEEGGHGAKKMIEDGALDGIDVIFGWHNWPAIPYGKAVCPDGAVMSGNGSFHIQVKGLGGHASQPEACRDPVLAAAAITLNLQQIVSRKLPPQASAVVSVTRLNADSDVTVIPQIVHMAGGIRISDPKWRAQINELIVQIAEDTAKTYGVEAKVEILPRYEATINDANAAEIYRAVLKSELGEDYSNTELMVPIMASEDFSYYLQKIPGAFALIGMAENQAEGQRYHYPCHNPHYEFNDRLIETVMRSFSKLTGLNHA
ncbi:MAG: N(2)-acetyl-L-2,4-diaminobutanoate deacetylase DoeB2 [Thiomicrorhabdus chilensis]|uniref:N(2)-acetyl-L-2,4-diaminobutanoate deacetylase DoeB2 n=1 Tax=Thiomicrorhabdus chilensis TaxID=63656 RepID=UPI00299EB5C9|nr:N(2)-acetyl-L-2,4-diaminobutanoate deacetylase DoeB2 [Thiomicrorhabdus chilensis]MDX1347894.1 N(2)-acetyl-L-2,4-diaminobutanoate deacetylase DoeB2 [Thiomicrorhabdus chilensis]